MIQLNFYLQMYKIKGKYIIFHTKNFPNLLNIAYFCAEFQNHQQRELTHELTQASYR